MDLYGPCDKYKPSDNWVNTEPCCLTCKHLNEMQNASCLILLGRAERLREEWKIPEDVE